MKIDPAKPYAVITGDFIGFSRLPLQDRQNMYALLKKGGESINTAFPELMPLPPDMFRGDGWQMVLANPIPALRAGLYFRAFIRANTSPTRADTRLSIAVGRIDYVPEGRVSAGDGEAFRLSGRLLEKMDRPRSGSMRFVMNDATVSPQLDALVRLLGAIADRWTPRQSLAVSGALQGWTHKQIGRLWKGKISHQAVGRHLDRAAWPAVNHGVEVFEAVLSQALR